LSAFSRLWSTEFGHSGHTARDALLKIVADRMVACVRPTDAVVRLGGDELVILLVDLPASPVAISDILHTLMAAITEPIAFYGDEIPHHLQHGRRHLSAGR
jgi:GGDEF domain-containing protein